MPFETIIIVLLILMLSTTVRSTFGFGDALIAMPLLSMAAGIKTAVPIVALGAIVIAVSILIKFWRQVEFRVRLPLIISSVAGIPIGLIYLKDTDETIVKLILAAILIAFAAYRLVKPHLLHLKNERLAVLFGLAGGILGGAYNTNGPPIIIYGAMRRWEPEKFRAILQGIFLPTNFFIAIGHGIAGFWTSEVIRLFLTALPVIIISIIIGGKINKKIPAHRFVKYVDIFLIIIGIILIYDSLAGSS